MTNRMEKNCMAKENIPIPRSPIRLVSGILNSAPSILTIQPEIKSRIAPCMYPFLSCIPHLPFSFSTAYESEKRFRRRRIGEKETTPLCGSSSHRMVSFFVCVSQDYSFAPHSLQNVSPALHSLPQTGHFAAAFRPFSFSRSSSISRCFSSSFPSFSCTSS